ncbi:M20 family metallo-hydrolase [Candidatus Azobacteroides pseudotrichonymphae]|jgi:acetylornithine deacetylase|uniref:Succinyl-diaminopimelate desuccinylase n=1 Tax=Azobacteroides pseudotrichonymphae genomovar. CFP2 TaxID=511995 RepID=B6YR22_AZOPC|nr:M20 family metallo-hydrolase [Candidatus Azobacteroides pseudotrichonymphae]MDR0529956.1 M20 family metallo-hydrolase [Bacteroidales bacterium OttesenSCG-928-I14]BAG83644.1 succinyl-diaminopimelate desuccinylase [Candidatus Azobacteroides pseudotrichonymphae genomovar. CFP2]
MFPPTNKALNLLKKLISIPSFSREETEAANWLEFFLIKENFRPKRKGNNIWVLSDKWDDTKPTILLNSHIDTVKPVYSWTKNPFSPLEENKKLYGLGSNDAGASLVALLQSFFILTSRWQPNNFIFLVSCEEEVSGSEGLGSVLTELPPITLAVVGEPTEMQPAVAERGLMVLDGTVYGKSGHAARDEGINAIYKAIPIINWFQNLQFPLKSDWLGSVKSTITMIQSGMQHNIIPDICQFTVDIRSNECYTNKQLFEEIIRTSPCEIKARSLRLNSSQISLDNPLIRRAKSFGLKPFGSLTLSDQALMNFPSLKIGPGDSSRSHIADEFVYLSEIEEAIKLYFCLLNNLTL